MVRPRLPDRRSYRVALTVSVCAHVLVLALVLLRLPVRPMPEPPEQPAVEMEFEKAGPQAQPVRADKPAREPAPPAVEKKQAPPSPVPPEKLPEETPPPSPPPPPPARSAPQTPPVTAKSRPVPPKETEPEPRPVKAPPPKPVPPKPHKTVAPVAGPEHKAEKTPPNPTPSHTTQPHEAKKTKADSHSLLATLDSFRTDQKQDRPPRAHPNPSQGGAPRGGGSPDGDTRALSATDQKAIGASVRRCYSEDTEARNYASFVAHMVVTVDADGEARLVTFTPETAARMAADPSYRVLAERARAAVLSPVCAHLPIPSSLLGKTRQLRFVFRP